MYKSLPKTKQYSEREAHETLKRVASANAIIKHYKSSSLRAISGIVHAHHSCGGKRGESCLGPVFRPFSNSHQYRFQIRLRLVDISAFSGQNKVTKMCPKYILTRYYK